MRALAVLFLTSGMLWFATAVLLSFVSGVMGPALLATRLHRAWSPSNARRLGRPAALAQPVDPCTAPEEERLAKAAPTTQ